jgi:hypothetical protein
MKRQHPFIVALLLSATTLFLLSSCVAPDSHRPFTDEELSDVLNDSIIEVEVSPISATFTKHPLVCVHEGDTLHVDSYEIGIYYSETKGDGESIINNGLNIESGEWGNDDFHPEPKQDDPLYEEVYTVYDLKPGTEYYFVYTIFNYGTNHRIISEPRSFKTKELKDITDLGLSVKWSGLPTGASDYSDFGELYAWGETETKNAFTIDDYKWFSNVLTLENAITVFKTYDGSFVRYDSINETYYHYTKYNSNHEEHSNGRIDTVPYTTQGLSISSSYPYFSFVGDNKTALDNEDDAAYIKSNGALRMPYSEEFQELAENTVWFPRVLNGQHGFLGKSSVNGEFLFISFPFDKMNPSDPIEDGNPYIYFWCKDLDLSKKYDDCINADALLELRASEYRPFAFEFSFSIYSRDKGKLVYSHYPTRYNGYRILSVVNE